MEIITGAERRRRWRLEETLRIVAEVEHPPLAFHLLRSRNLGQLRPVLRSPRWLHCSEQLAPELALHHRPDVDNFDHPQAPQDWIDI